MLIVRVVGRDDKGMTGSCLFNMEHPATACHALESRRWREPRYAGSDHRHLESGRGRLCESRRRLVQVHNPCVSNNLRAGSKMNEARWRERSTPCRSDRRSIRLMCIHMSGRERHRQSCFPRPGGHLAQRAVESRRRDTRKTSRSESLAAVCWYATRMIQQPQALPVDLSDVANL